MPNTEGRDPPAGFVVGFRKSNVIVTFTVKLGDFDCKCAKLDFYGKISQKRDFGVKVMFRPKKGILSQNGPKCPIRSGGYGL